MKKFRCVPLLIGIPVIFGISALCWVPFLLHLELFVNSKGEQNPLGGLILCSFMILFSLLVMFVSLGFAVKRIEVHSDKIVYKGFLPKDTFAFEYGKCNIGMDYHVQNGGKIWWIYFYTGKHPQYKSNNPASRINSVKIQPGFVRVMYSEELYRALMETMPPKQCTALKSILRCSNFDKQGKII